jgi:hypothetical protein
MPRRPAPAWLLSERELAMRLTAAYYAVLNEQPKFQADLRALYDGLDVTEWREPTERELEQLRGFAQAWRLPTAFGVDDLWESTFEEFDPFTAGQTPLPRIRLGDPMVQSRRWASGETPKLSVAPHLREESPGDVSTYITPWQPPPIHYTPFHMSPRRLREQAEQIAQRVKASILEQAEALEREAQQLGWRAVPPRHHSRKELRHMALRLYRRAVLRWPWAKIAREEGDEAATRAVRDSVTSWARTLGVPLP